MLDNNYNNIDPYFITGITDAIFQKDSIRLFSTKRNTNNSLNLEIWGTNLRSSSTLNNFQLVAQIKNLSLGIFHTSKIRCYYTSSRYNNSSENLNPNFVSGLYLFFYELASLLACAAQASKL